ncbi:MAG TPA: hypothetical protein DCR14_06550 [Acidimicrobiaceae bacterium]|nr:hypothetical protein [Acidimicrobiaceae bacterium]
MTDAHSSVEERHASYLELFLDLVFVLAITQIAFLISHHPDAAGTGKGLLITLLVWWQWSQFTWAGSALDLHRTAFSRVLVLAILPVALLVAASIPDAFDGAGPWFGTAYLGVQLLVLAIHAVPAMAAAATRAAFIRYASVVVVSPVLVFVGGLVHDEWRVGLWIAAVLANTAGALRAAGSEWAVDPVHFAERHSLFIIISLGEVLVAAGASLSGIGISAEPVVGLVAAVIVACTMWWTYFAYIPEVGERRLREAAPVQRGVIARDMYTFGHFPLVVGLVLYAVVVKHLIAHPFDVLEVEDRWLLALSVASFVGGLILMQWQAVRKVAPERVVAVGVGAGLALGLGSVLAGAAVVALVALLYGVMQAVTLHRLRG